MVCKAFWRKYENLIGTGLLLLVLLVFTSVRYDYYFDLNDDVLMKDILAGVYTGEPESRNIQMIWPVSAFLSLLYRMGRGLPWYGIFLCLCHFGSIALIVHRSLCLCRRIPGKALLLAGEGVLLGGLLLPHLVSVQYTVTSALLASAAAFLFMTTDAAEPGDFIRKNVITVFLAVLAYLVRPWMLLLLLPLICAAGLIRWSGEEKIFARENWIKYLAVIGAVLAGIGLGQLCHQIAYGSAEWKTFLEYFNNRTELYDFQTLPEYEKHRDFYEREGLKQSEWELLDNYNFGLDPAIDEKLLGAVAEYAAANRSERKPFMQKLRESLGQYYRRMVYPPWRNESDFPWSWLVIFSYLAALVTAVPAQGKRPALCFFQAALRLLFLLMVRTVLWIWLIYRNRVPVRISHSMYLMELGILLGLVLVQCARLWRGAADRRRLLPAGIGIVYALAGFLILPRAIEAADTDVAAKAAANIRYERLYSCLGSGQRRENFYFIDVYSSVAYTEKLFVNVDNSLDNYDIMGGWACKSPLWHKKLGVFGITDVQEALAERDDVFYVQEAGADAGWLQRYYGECGSEVQIHLTEMVEDEFEIYRISRK